MNDVEHVEHASLLSTSARPLINEWLADQKYRVGHQQKIEGTFTNRMHYLLGKGVPKRTRVQALLELPSYLAPELYDRAVDIFADKFFVQNLPLPISEDLSFEGRLGLGGISNVYLLEDKSGLNESKVLKVMRSYGSNVTSFSRYLLNDTFIPNHAGVDELLRISTLLKQETQWLKDQYEGLESIFPSEEHLIIGDPLQPEVPRLALLQKYYNPPFRDVFDHSFQELYELPSTEVSKLTSFFSKTLDLSDQGYFPDLIGRKNISIHQNQEFVYMDPHNVFLVNQPLPADIQRCYEYRRNFMIDFLQY